MLELTEFVLDILSTNTVTWNRLSLLLLPLYFSGCPRVDTTGSDPYEPSLKDLLFSFYYLVTLICWFDM